ncbi:lipocalin family protein [uncultured Winogradskyella sp.]|uniref:lipocalin family protein n=1 Tax=uncultured Winogradskyella sp. TaxID=395353 RepID=UPI0030EC63C1
MKNIFNIMRPSFTTNCINLYKLKTTLLLVLMVSIFSCSKNPESYIKHIEGYWEIQEVTMADGSKKEYKFNETIDYIGINDSLKGFRKKLKPGINDTYFTSGDAEDIQLKVENDKLYIYYTTPYANWKETVLNANAKQLKIMNEDQNIYLYKRYTSIILDLEE